MPIPAARPAARVPGLLLGVGLGGFVDGIVLHQILQWHHMVSHTEDHPVTTLDGLKANVLADGLFHLAVWLCVVAGMVLTIKAWRQGRLPPTWSGQAGLVLAGWGAFNLIEGLINHQILGVHHVRDDLGAPLSWDLAFLAFGVAQILIGWALQLDGGLRQRSAPRPDAR